MENGEFNSSFSILYLPGSSFAGKQRRCTNMTQQQRRSSSDDDSNNDHEPTSGHGKSGGNAGAGKSGTEGLGTEKKSEDERFGSQKPEKGRHSER